MICFSLSFIIVIVDVYTHWRLTKYSFQTQFRALSPSLAPRRSFSFHPRPVPLSLSRSSYRSYFSISLALSLVLSPSRNSVSKTQRNHLTKKKKKKKMVMCKQEIIWNIAFLGAKTTSSFFVRTDSVWLWLVVFCCCCVFFFFFFSAFCGIAQVSRLSCS